MSCGRLLGLAFTLLSLWLASACKSAPLATLSQGEGVLWRDHATSINGWETAAIGATFEFGEAFRTEANATGLLTLDDKTRLKVQPSTTVRFQQQLNTNTTKSVLVEDGTVLVETEEKALTLQTELGPAIIWPRAVVRWVRHRNGSRLSVDVGTAQLDPDGANERTLVQGESLDISIGKAVLESPPPPTSPNPTPSESPNSSMPVDPTAITLTVQSGQVAVFSGGSTTKFTSGTHTITPPGTLKLGVNTSANLTSQGRTVNLRGPGSYAINTGPDFLRIAKGSLELRSRGSDAPLAVPGGTVVALHSDPESIVEIVRSGQHTEVFVKRGKATVTQGQQLESLSAGEGAKLDARRVLVQGRNGGRRDLQLRVGDSPVIHNPQSPTGVGFDISQRCNGIGLVELMNGPKVKAWAAGRGTLNLTLPMGVHAYRVRCLSESGELSAPQTSGRVTLVADNGGVQLPKTAPSNFVRTDGRRYTLLYQNRLPSVTVSWVNAPAADAYTLNVTSRGKTRALETAAPQYTFSSGSLSEGEHTFSFVSALGRSSRVSVVEIQFDNVAPKAAITAPESGSFAPGEEVAVGGIALPGWDVTVQGRPMLTDNQGRFSGKVVADASGVSFLFSSPGRGVHQYVRRARSLD